MLNSEDISMIRDVDRLQQLLKEQILRVDRLSAYYDTELKRKEDLIHSILRQADNTSSSGFLQISPRLSGGSTSGVPQLRFVAPLVGKGQAGASGATPSGIAASRMTVSTSTQTTPPTTTTTTTTIGGPATPSTTTNTTAPIIRRTPGRNNTPNRNSGGSGVINTTPAIRTPSNTNGGTPRSQTTTTPGVVTQQRPPSPMVVRSAGTPRNNNNNTPSATTTTTTVGGGTPGSQVRRVRPASPMLRKVVRKEQ
eukprot:PhF_6_TR15107/c0_g1_i1/m.23789